MPVGIAKAKQPESQQPTTPKLWMVLVGVNQYEDEGLPSLRYSALDCQGLSTALEVATQGFANKQVYNCHDFANDLPLLNNIRDRLTQITNHAQADDTVLFYFSGHGILHPHSQQTFLCLRDTQKENLEQSAIAVADLLGMLAACAARQQIVWLDACHSGGMTLRGTATITKLENRLNPTRQLVKVLQTAAASSQGFYALLSCDIDQQSWEFPELGHGVFTYFLMRGLRGEAANSEGIITADELYRYVYYQTLQYIDKTNQQVRLINQQRRGKGDTNLFNEYPLQTPKRIVEGVGEVILGQISTHTDLISPRLALVVEGMGDSQTTLALSKVLHGRCGLELTYVPRGENTTIKDIRQAIQTNLKSSSSENQHTATTALIYLRGKLQETPTGDAALVLANEIWLSRTWLRQQLRRTSVSHLVVILDCCSEQTTTINLQEWIEDLQDSTEQGLCIIAGNSPSNQPNLFTTALIETLNTSPIATGLSAAGLIAQLQIALAGKLSLDIWLSGTRGVIEIIPGTPSNLSGNISSQKATGVDLGICPYLGLKAFAENDAQYFYGREALSQNLISHISQNSFLAVVGASGSGKSSVVQAGVIAQLRQGKVLPGSETWLIKTIRPGTRPLEMLALALSQQPHQPRLTSPSLTASQMEAILYQGVEGFVYWLRSRPEPVIMLVIDQFEELFTLATQEDRNRFLELLLGAVTYAGDRVKLIVTLRADFIAPCLQIPALAPLLQTSSILVPPHLTQADYRSVIVNPAEYVGLQVESGLVEVLLQELSHTAGDLPLLEFVLEQLWESRQEGVLTLAAYQQHLGGIAGALERKAESVYQNFSQLEQECAQWIFLSLTQLGEGTEDTRRRVFKSDLVVRKYPTVLVEKVLQTLVAAKLIVVNLEEHSETMATSRGENNPETETKLQLTSPVTVEVAHEILIRHWSTLRWWLEENRSRLRSQRQIEQAMVLWKHSGEQVDFLLQGIRLAEAEEIFIKYTDELSSDVQRFIAACLDQRQRQQVQQKQRLRQTQLALGVISILGVAATGFGGFAFLQRQMAITQEISALNSASQAFLQTHQQLEALVTGIKARRQLKQLFAADSQIQIATAASLQQALDLTQEVNRLQAHTDKVNQVKFSPDGQLMITGSNDATVKIWSRTGQLINTLTQPQDRVTVISFSIDGNLIAVGSADQNIYLYNRGGKLIQTLSGHEDFVTSLAFHPTQDILISGSRDRTMRFWQLSTGKLIKTINNSHNGWVNTILTNSTGELIFSGGEDNLIKIWNFDVNNSQLAKNSLVSTLSPHKNRITQLQLAANQQKLAASYGDGQIIIWDLNTGNSQKTVAFSQLVNMKLIDSPNLQINSISWTPDSQKIITGTSDGKIKVWQLQTQAKNLQLIATYQGHSEQITNITISPDGKYIASSSDDKTVRIWNLSKSPKLSNQPIYSLDYDDRTRTIIAGGWDGNVQILHNPFSSVHTPKLIHQFSAHQSIITAIKYSPNRKYIATASADRNIKIWDANNYRLIQQWQGHNDRITSLAFHPQANLLVTASADKTIKIWQIPTGKLLKVIAPNHTDEITSIAISKNAQILAAVSINQQIQLWQIPDGKLIRTIKDNSQLVTKSPGIAAVVISPNNQILATANWDNTIQLWQMQNGDLIHTLTGHSDGVTSLSFHPNGEILASGSADRTIKLWNVKNAKLIQTLVGNISQINTIKFSQDGKSLISGDEKNGIKIWNLDLDNLFNHTCQRINDYLASNLEIASDDKYICRN